MIKRYCSGKVRNVWLCTLYFDLMTKLRTFNGDLSGLLVQYCWKLEQSLPHIILFLRHLVINSSKQKTASHLHLNGKGDWSDHTILLLVWSLKNIILCQHVWWNSMLFLQPPLKSMLAISRILLHSINKRKKMSLARFEPMSERGLIRGPV